MHKGINESLEEIEKSCEDYVRTGKIKVTHVIYIWSMKLTILDKSLLKTRLYLNFPNLSRKISEKVSRTENLLKFESQNITLTSTSGIIPFFLNATFVGQYI